jgi:hypothetical protein
MGTHGHGNAIDIDNVQMMYRIAKADAIIGGRIRIHQTTFVRGWNIWVVA